MESPATASSGAELFWKRPVFALVSEFHWRARSTAALARLTTTRRIVQHPRCLWGAHPPLFLAQRDIQSMVHPAFDDPVAALEREHPLGWQLLEAQAAQQVDHLAAPFAFAPECGGRRRARSYPRSFVCPALAPRGDFVALGLGYYVMRERNAQEHFAAQTHRLCFCGHTHVPMVWHLSNKETIKKWRGQGRIQQPPRWKDPR